jgi:hypothetical protein
MSTAAKKDPSSIASELRKFLVEQHGRRDELTAQREKLKAEIDALYAAPLQREDVLHAWHLYIDRLAAEFPKEANWRDQLQRYACSYTVPMQPALALNLRDIDALIDGNLSGLTQVVGIDGWNFFNGIVHPGAFTVAYFFFGDIIKKKLTENFDEFFPGYKSVGPEKIGLPIADRRKRIAELESQIALVANELGEVNALIEKARV